MSVRKVEVTDKQMQDLRRLLPKFTWTRYEYSVDGELTDEYLKSTIIITSAQESGTFYADIHIGSIYAEEDTNLVASSVAPAVNGTTPFEAAVKVLHSMKKKMLTLLGD